MVSPSMGRYGGMEAFSLTLVDAFTMESGLKAQLMFKRAGDFALADDLRGAVAGSAAPVRFCAKLSFDLVRAIWQADLVHVQNPCPDVVYLARLFRRPLLVNVINHLGEGRSLRQQLWRRGLRLADRRFYISEFVRRSWEGAKTWPRSQVVFPICELPEGSVPLAERKGFAFVSRWIPNKGIETLVEAYRLAGLDPVKWPLRLMGDGPLRAGIERRIAKLGIAGIELLGFASQEKKADVIRGSRFVVIPPHTREDFGLVAIEARNVGVPCIITRDGGLSEAAGEGAISCEPGNAEALAECLRKAATMPENEYSVLAERTREALQRELVQPAFYARTYREMLAA